MQIGQKIRKVRELRNYTQDYMADRLGIAQISYSRLENSQTKMDINRLQQIAQILEVDPITLMSFDESYIFNNCHQPQGNNCQIYNNSVLSNIEKETLLKRIQELENELLIIKRAK